ncbi:hypothetical protein OH76DRAFT_1099505 [Lentinus brumalis]|uniref:Uncharacterized protein n=1 Tax=Lentinus brumalis TaxID=2498619 RepID=A0A371CVV8_9APHY|nr:hypothetical protein OH76DRAFT_1099505 [Polyporus brumalis]
MCLSFASTPSLWVSITRRSSPSSKAVSTTPVSPIPPCRPVPATCCAFSRTRKPRATSLPRRGASNTRPEDPRRSCSRRPDASSTPCTARLRTSACKQAHDTSLSACSLVDTSPNTCSEATQSHRSWRSPSLCSQWTSGRCACGPSRYVYLAEHRGRVISNVVGQSLSFGWGPQIRIWESQSSHSCSRAMRILVSKQARSISMLLGT